MIGLLARADRTGLAIQTLGFWRNMHPDKTLLVDFTRFGFRPEPRLYSGTGSVEVWEVPHYGDLWNTRETPTVERFLEGLTAVFSVESPYDYHLLTRAAQKGVKTVIQPNYEFADWLNNPSIPHPDVFALPTPWHEEHWRKCLGSEVVDLPVPVDLGRLPRRHVTELSTVLHVAGNVAQTDRAGTHAFVEAMRRVRSPVKGLIHAQRPMPDVVVPDNVVKRTDASFPTHEDLYVEGDLLCLPRRYGGLCLPMQEAMGCGIPVLMTDVPPQRDMLPMAMLVASSWSKTLQTRHPIDVWDVNVDALARAIDELYERPAEMDVLARTAREWAEERSWDQLRPRYKEVLS